ncbi:hypothetical protein F2Q69_00029353 [Brassica cretica]|uniref:RNase H type-1 domain-containing protein n=1 Tax=Brassica cretica TaxID=69181 RepID=A0A8S9RWY1_BRACR|nr:hypothetical protein F2Q69_00029353 [Brassica cretica]
MLLGRLLEQGLAPSRSRLDLLESDREDRERSSLRHSLSIDIENLRVFTDNQTLIRALTSKLMEKEIFGVVADIRNLSALFESISFNFIPRSENFEADHLAKAVLRDPSSSTFTFPGQAQCNRPTTLTG